MRARHFAEFRRSLEDSRANIERSSGLKPLMFGFRGHWAACPAAVTKHLRCIRFNPTFWPLSPTLMLPSMRFA